MFKIMKINEKGLFSKFLNNLMAYIAFLKNYISNTIFKN